MTFTILFVCTGNICRSPIAEHLARATFDERLGADAALLAVASAGTWGHEGSRMEPEAVQALALSGIDGQQFRARELTREMIAEADLILTAAREHDVAALALDPAAGDRIFALTEFARLVCAVDVAGLPADLEGRARAVVALAAAARAGDAGAGTSSDADLADPFGAPVRVFARTAAQIRALLEPLVSTLGGVPAQATPGSSLIARAGMVQP